MAATQAQIDAYKYHRDICLSLEIAESTLYHRAPEGTIVPVAGTRNKEYIFPPDRIASQGIANTYAVWAFWKPKEVRATSFDAGDTSAIESWDEYVTVQFPAIQDDGTVLVVQDADWLLMPNGDWMKIENPTQDATGGYWYANGHVQR